MEASTSNSLTLYRLQDRPPLLWTTHARAKEREMRETIRIRFVQLSVMRNSNPTGGDLPVFYGAIQASESALSGLVVDSFLLSSTGVRFPSPERGRISLY